jgi:hypothetical protein
MVKCWGVIVKAKRFRRAAGVQNERRAREIPLPLKPSFLLAHKTEIRKT